MYTVHCDVIYHITGKVKELSITNHFFQLFDFLYYRFGLVVATGNVNAPRLMSHTGRVCKVVCMHIIVFLQLEQWRSQNLSAGTATEIM